MLADSRGMSKHIALDLLNQNSDNNRRCERAIEANSPRRVVRARELGKKNPTFKAKQNKKTHTQSKGSSPASYPGMSVNFLI